MPGLYLLIYIERVPNDSTSRVKAVSMPLMIEAISITVTTPMITPMIVRNERSLLSRSVARASHRFSRMSLLNSFMISLLTHPLLALQSDQVAPLSTRARVRKALQLLLMPPGQAQSQPATGTWERRSR